MPNIETITVNGTQYSINDPNALGGASYTATFLSSGWTTDSNGYKTQTVVVNGLADSYTVPPDVDVVLSGTNATNDTNVLVGFASINIISTGANSLTAKCINTAPTVNIPVKVRVFV